MCVCIFLAACLHEALYDFVTEKSGHTLVQFLSSKKNLNF